jgi:hypothetical protein
MIKGNIVNIDASKNMVDRLQQAQQTVYGKAVQFSLLAQQKIQQNLNDVLGDKAKHFEVTMEGGGFMTIITVGPKTNAGSFMLTGTKPHKISSGARPMPLGDGRFAYTVSHPGTESRRKEIEGAITRGYLEAKTALYGYPKGMA